MGKDKNLHYAVLLTDLINLCVLATGYYYLLMQFRPESIASITLHFILTTMVVAFVISFLLNPSVSHERFTTSEEVVRRVSLNVILFLLFTVGIIITMRPNIHFPRFFVFSFFAIYATSLYAERLLIRRYFQWIRTNKRNQIHVVFVGKDKNIFEIYRFLSQPAYGYKIEGYFCDDEDVENETLQQLRKGTSDEIYDWLVAHPNINEVYAYYPAADHNKINMLSKFCDNNLIRLYYVPTLGMFNGNVRVQRLGQSVVMARREEPLTQPFNKFIKRTFDLILSSLFLVCIYPFIYLFCAFMIKRQSPGPVYFKQERTGLNGQVFKCIKFRSMKPNDDADTLQATKDDPRKFPFGDFMRKTNLDEIPQLINVWRGEMSLVGPRPHMLKHTEEYSHIINRFMVRHLAKPGITGLAQVSGFRGETRYIDQMEGRVLKDIEYIENWTFLLDLRIIVKTFTNMIGGEKNAY